MRQIELRSALYHRFHRLVPFIAHPVAVRLWHVAVWGFWAIYFGFVLLVLLLRYSILPNIENYRADIERIASDGLGLAVSIGRIDASWEGINPDLTLLDVRVADADGRPALAFSRVETILSWWSVPQLQLTLRLLRIDEPTLHLRRAADGQLFIAGIPLSQQSSDVSASDWILAQRRIRINGATVVWEDEQRKAPPLLLEQLNFSLDNNGSQHRFGLTALPAGGLVSKVDLRGDFRGRDLDELESWKGQIYAELEDTDLAVWRNWVDYPVGLPHGRGAVRAWVGFAGGVLREITADVALKEVSLRLAKDLPTMELQSMSGRIGAKFPVKGADFSGAEVIGRGIELMTHAQKGKVDGGTLAAIKIPPTDFRVDWQAEQAASGARAVSGSASASSLDLEALASLAAYLPLDAQSRKLLKDFAPRGQIADLRSSWRGDAESLKDYALNARFNGLALKAQGYFPGFTGLSGTLDANEQGGSASLLSQKSSIDLPSIFPESLIALDMLKAQAKWKIKNGQLEAELSRVDFSGPDADGSAQGSYRTTPEGPGIIDMTATVTRGDGRAVWRYMPHVVNEPARFWLRDSLKTGTGSNAKLVLKGDLKHFPFLDKKTGQFLVTARASDVTLDYASSWPPITGLVGDLRFEGAGMTVDSKEGAILGTRIAQVHAEIADFDAPISVLTVKGRVEGPTAEFLKFIEQSPVGERIDHFTEPMRATGDGRLDIGLSIPLDSDHLAESRVDGSYRLKNNEVTIDSALPPLRKVNGTVQFTDKDMRLPEIRGTLFDGPLTVKGGTQRDGRVSITADGSLPASQLAKQLDLPLLEKLSGTVKYHGEVRVKKGSADLTISSNLLGLASTLPEPFSKKADETLPLHFEKVFLPSVTQRNGEVIVREQIGAKLGNLLSMQLLRRKQGDSYLIERGAIALGRPLQLPERGLTVGVTAKRLDADHWRQALLTKSVAGKADEVPSTLQIDAFNLKTDVLQLLGHQYDDVDLAASSGNAMWRIHLASRQATGDLQWEGTGRGKLKARLKHLLIEPPSGVPVEKQAEAIEALPALDIVADSFAIDKRQFGRLELQARNEGQLWRLDKVQLANPYGTLNGSGQWQIGGGISNTKLDFKLDSSDIGKLLDRLGYADAVRGGTATLAGKIGWNGPPTGLDYPTLGGEISVEAAKGQFAKLDPGAGRLLGLISLQALPRRITLDFRDVFSDGFSFDSIAGKVNLKNGVMRTDRLQIDGPAARIVMRGETDLQRETARLTVNVQPELGASAAFGVALINPIAGVATLLAHKILQNPLNQMFGFDYLVTGTWDDPKVEKLSRLEQSVPSTPRLPNLSPATGVNNDTPQ